MYSSFPLYPKNVVIAVKSETFMLYLFYRDFFEPIAVLNIYLNDLYHDFQKISDVGPCKIASLYFLQSSHVFLKFCIGFCIIWWMNLWRSKTHNQRINESLLQSYRSNFALTLRSTFSLNKNWFLKNESSETPLQL